MRVGDRVQIVKDTPQADSRISLLGRKGTIVTHAKNGYMDLDVDVKLDEPLPDSRWNALLQCRELLPRTRGSIWCSTNELRTGCI